MTERLDALRARIAALEQLLEVQEEAALRQTRRVDATMEQLRERATELERSRLALLASEERKAAIVENALDCIITIDAGARVLEFNPAAERVFGYSEEDVVGRHLADFIIPERYRAAHREGIEHYFRTGEGPLLMKRIETTAVRADGSEFPVELTITPQRVDGSTYFTGFLRDISQAKKDQERVRNLTSLMEVALAHLSLDELLPEFQQRLQTILRSDTVTVMLIDDENLVVRSSLGVDETTIRGVAIPIGYGLAGELAQTRRPLIVDNVDSHEVSPIIRAGNIRSLMGVPLIVEGDMIGVVLVGSKQARRFSEDDLSLLALAADRMAIAIDHARLYEREQNIAHTLQMSMLPERLPETSGISVSVRYVPAEDGTRVGGDWYDVIQLPSGEVGIVIGDVAGRGIRAAAVMGELRHALRAYAFDGHSPKLALERLDQLVQDTGGTEMATLFFGAFDPRSGLLRYTSAGHPPPLVLAPDGTCTFLEGGRSVPLGVMAGATFEMDAVTLEPGSLLLTYTDGLVEERDVTLDEGMERLAASVAAAPEALEDLCDYVLASIFGSGGPKDDVAFLAVRYGSAEPERLSLALPATSSSLVQLRRRFERWLRSHGVDDDTTFEMVVALNEAAANAVEHAYGLQAATFDVAARIDDDVLDLVVSDRGNWREPVESDRGRGIPLMKTIMDEVQIDTDSTGTRVTMRKRLFGGGES